LERIFYKKTNFLNLFMNIISMNRVVRMLKEGKKGIAIWGIGYIGYSSMAYFARAGIRCLGYDVNEERVKQINENGKIKPNNLPNIDFWLGFDITPLFADGLIKATHNHKDLISNEYLIHLIAVPTEKVNEYGEHKPYTGYLKDVFEKLTEYKNIKTDHPPLIIIESTLSVNVLDHVVIPILESYGIKVGEDVLLGIAPRRDWFVERDKTLKNLPRVVGGTNKETSKLMKEVLGLICDKILEAEDHKHAALVKTIENAYRHMDITLANQLSRAYPDLNMKHILELVGTKWNIGTFKPSFGIGGYCIPLAPHYVLGDAKNPEELTLLKSSTEFDEKHTERLAHTLIKKGVKNVGILGVAYAPDLKVHVLSPALKIVRHLKKAGISVKINDPYYTDEELKQITGAEPFKFPEGLNQFDTVLLVSGHMKYRYTNHNNIKNNLKNCKLILDNSGIWKKIDFNPVEYHEAGDKNWLLLDE